MPRPVFMRLGGELGRRVVADHRVERGDDADAVVDVVAADVLVGRDAVDAVHAQRPRRVHEQRLRLEDAGGDHRLEDVELELPGLGAPS